MNCNNASAPKLKRVLSLWHLLVYGMIIMQVAAPVPIFGLLEKRSDGHAVTAVLIAMVAMMITAISYGRMAMLYPMAGSAYTYVARSIQSPPGLSDRLVHVPGLPDHPADQRDHPRAGDPTPTSLGFPFPCSRC